MTQKVKQNIDSPKKYLTLNKTENQPIHLQIYGRFKEAIEGSLLKAGDRVPSSRTLAGELDVARGTVENAYAMLLGEGIFESRGQSGTFISNSLVPSATKKLQTFTPPSKQIAASVANTHA